MTGARRSLRFGVPPRGMRFLLHSAACNRVRVRVRIESAPWLAARDAATSYGARRNARRPQPAEGWRLKRWIALALGIGIAFAAGYVQRQHRLRAGSGAPVESIGAASRAQLDAVLRARTRGEDRR